MAAGFIFSDEVTSLVDTNGDGTLSNDEFLAHMYRSVLGREPDNDGYVWWLGELDSGAKSQTDVMVDMTQSNEYVELTVSATVDYLVG